MPFPPQTPQERLQAIEAKIARLDRRARGGLTCCGEIGGIRSRSTKRKNQIADGRVSASVELVKLYPLRDRLRATVERMARGEPEPVAKLTLIERVRAAREAAKAARVAAKPREKREFIMLPPKVTTTFTDDDAANAYMETHENEGVLRVRKDGVIELADLRDLGTKSVLSPAPSLTAFIDAGKDGLTLFNPDNRKVFRAVFVEGTAGVTGVCIYEQKNPDKCVRDPLMSRTEIADWLSGLKLVEPVKQEAAPDPFEECSIDPVPRRAMSL